MGCDVKLVMKVLSLRLKRPMDYLIDIMQSAFLKDRDISDNVRYHLGLTTRLRELGLPGWLLPSDLNKAYDTTNRQWFYKVMTSQGFNVSGITRWFRISMEGSTARIRINGILSPAFPVENGFTQGGPHSPDGWAIVLQPHFDLLQSLQRSGRLPHIPLPSGKPLPPAAAHADDITALIQDPASEGLTIQQSFQESTQAGNPEQSIAKTGLLLLHHPDHMGPLPPAMDYTCQPRHATTGYELIPTNTPYRILGAPLGRDQSQCADFAYNQQPGSMRATASSWSAHPPSRLGRALVANQCIASKAVYQMAFTKPRLPQLKQMQRAVNGFVATSPIPWEEVPFQGRLYPSAEAAYLPVSAGGMGVQDLSIMSKALLAKTAWSALLFSSHPWVELYRHEKKKKNA